MPYALIILGAVLLVAGIRGTYKDLWALVQGDFSGDKGFLAWVAAIAVVGGIGYIPKLKPLSVAFMTLLLLVLILSNKGVFAKLESAIKSGAPAPNNTSVSDNAAQAGEALTNIAEIGANLAAIA